VNAHHVVAEYVVLRCRCGVEVVADSEELAENLLAEHIPDLVAELRTRMNHPSRRRDLPERLDGGAL
jgi:hypothetical protein